MALCYVSGALEAMMLTLSLVELNTATNTQNSAQALWNINQKVDKKW